MAGWESLTDYILMGRAIDMIRIMRFFPMFRDVVRRSADVLPALAGPLILVLTINHVFVCFGMAMWSGAIDVDAMATNENITPLYYLNNFNSYTEGLVTMFNVLVVNDWHAIAEVFLYADRCSSPYLVYPFFIAGIFCGVFIMLNVITAFFVECKCTAHFCHCEGQIKRGI
jgi:two pore calcium channel protein